MEIKKAIIPMGGLGTRFLPLSKAVPKELWPLADKPVIHYIIEEARASGIKDIIFVLSPENKLVMDYLRPSSRIEKILKERKKAEILSELKKAESAFQDISFSYVLQKNPMGDGHAILQAEKFAKEEPVACLFADDIIDGKTPCLLQLLQVFKTSQKTIITLYRLPKNRVLAYGVAELEKIASRYYKVKKIVEKPSLEYAPSDMVLVGKYILTPEVFYYLKKSKQNKGGEIILAEILNQMLKDGKAIYGYEAEGRWLECGNKLSWLKSNLYFSLKHQKFGPELKDFLKEV